MAKHQRSVKKDLCLKLLLVFYYTSEVSAAILLKYFDAKLFSVWNNKFLERQNESCWQVVLDRLVRVTVNIDRCYIGLLDCGSLHSLFVLDKKAHIIDIK